MKKKELYNVLNQDNLAENGEKLVEGIIIGGVVSTVRGLHHWLCVIS